MEDTTTKPINKTEIELRGILDKIAEFQMDSDPESTVIQLPKEYDSTASTYGNNSLPVGIKLGYNRKVCRYAKKHGISEEKAFKILYH